MSWCSSWRMYSSYRTIVAEAISGEIESCRRRPLFQSWSVFDKNVLWNRWWSAFHPGRDLNHEDARQHGNTTTYEMNCLWVRLPQQISDRLFFDDNRFSVLTILCDWILCSRGLVPREWVFVRFLPGFYTKQLSDMNIQFSAFNLLPSEQVISWNCSIWFKVIDPDQYVTFALA